jgi:hypothetical protein
MGDVIDFKPKTDRKMTTDEFLDGFTLVSEGFYKKLIEDGIKHHELKMELL